MRFPEQHRVLQRITPEDLIRLLAERRFERAVERLADAHGRVNILTTCHNCCVSAGSLLENVCLDGVEDALLLAFNEATGARYAVRLAHFQLLTEPLVRYEGWFGKPQQASAPSRRPMG